MNNNGEETVREVLEAQVIVKAMRAGAREFIERPTTIVNLLEAFARLTTRTPRPELLS